MGQFRPNAFATNHCSSDARHLGLASVEDVNVGPLCRPDDRRQRLAQHATAWQSTSLQTWKLDPIAFPAATTRVLGGLQVRAWCSEINISIGILNCT